MTYCAYCGYLFEKGVADFIIKNLRPPTDCIVPAWVPLELAATNGKDLSISNNEVITYRGIRLIPSDSNKEMYFFIRY